MKIERVPIDSLRFDPANARQHDSRNLDAIKASLVRFNQVEPLVVQKGTNVVIGGNGRLEAAKQMGLAEIDVHYVDVSNTEATALGIALNRTTDLSTFDDVLLARHLEALREDEWDLEDLGFDDTFLKSDDIFNNGLDESNDDIKTKMETIVEITFPDRQAAEEKYEELLAEGLIVRLK